MTDTIFALASGQGRAAVAVVRISGPRTEEAVKALGGDLPRPRRASLRLLRRADGAVLDRALVLWFPAPNSYTGEACAEFHLHGGPAVVAGVLDALAGSGLRLAEPGEFTRRAFEAGKLDLAQAEAVADLVEAETAAQAQQALWQLGGALGRAQEGWRADLIGALALLEAAVDFPDEEVPEDVASGARPLLSRLIAGLEAGQQDVQRGLRVREGFRIAIVGAPNAGKSSLLNALAGREAAIVTSEPGTTRDIIEVHLALGGYKVVVADTAGLREATEEIEAEGVRRAKAWSAEADLRLWLVDGSAALSPAQPLEIRAGDICVLSKADLPPGGAGRDVSQRSTSGSLSTCELSLRGSMPGLGAIEELLTARVVAALAGREAPTGTRLRHGALLDEALAHLNKALRPDHSPELAAEDVRLAARALDRITGRIGTEDVLDRIFSSFCIGK